MTSAGLINKLKEMSGVTNTPNQMGAVELTENAGRALKLQTDTPHLVSLGGGRLSTAVTIHPIQQGRTTLGSGPGVDIAIQGTGVEPLHCQIENNSGIVTIYPISENVSIDGVAVVQPTRLAQGVMLTIGRSNYMRFNHPAEAQLIKSVLPNSRISMAPIKFDNEKPPVPRKIPVEPPSNIRTKVTKFEYLAAQNFKSISPKVFSSNLVTVNTPAKDVLGRAPPDLQHFAKNLQQPAVNYSDSVTYDKQKDKTADLYFGRKSPQYVNVAVAEAKAINNKVLIYENGCIPKCINSDKNELNSVMNNKVNVSRINVPSPSYNRNPSGYSKTQSGSPSNEGKNGSDSGFEDVRSTRSDDELRRNQAYAERIKDQEIEQAEQARLEEILSMCAEYERQAQNERSNKPPTPNRIITNGSLPRDKRNYPAFNTPSPSLTNSPDDSVFKFDIESYGPNYENVSLRQDKSPTHLYENVAITEENNYENVKANHGQFYPQSPRTRIKTIPPKHNKDSSKDHAQLIENKFAPLAAEQILHQNRQHQDTLKKQKRELLTAVSSVKRKMAEIQLQEEELNRDLEMERALINGEHAAKLHELANLEMRKLKLVAQAHEIDLQMSHAQSTQAEHQEACKAKLDLAQDNVSRLESKLAETPKTGEEHKRLFEEFLLAQEVLDNERKTFEDLEFHHLEEEADLLATREEIQREIVDLGKRIEAAFVLVNELEQQKVDASRTNAQENKTLERQLLKQLKKLEECRVKLGELDERLKSFKQEESDQEMSSDSECDKSMSYSFLVESRSCKLTEDTSNMSKSFNEKTMREKSILQDSFGNRSSPLHSNDIDRISKVTTDAPINIEEGQRSLGKKTIESLKEIELNRQLHLVQQGSQVIEEERRRLFQLKQKAQSEVKAQWAQRQLDSLSVTDITGVEKIEHNSMDDDSKQVRSESESPQLSRPLSDTSDLSVEVGGTLGRRKRQLIDKTRPLTRYLPIHSSELDLRQHIETAGHQVALCPHVTLNSASCRGFLNKRASKLNNWSRRWFVFDRYKRTFVYYTDKSEKKVRGGAYFRAIEEVYLDHSNSIKSPNPSLMFIVKTYQRHYYLMAPSPEAMRIWIDVIFTGAEGYQEFEHGS